MISTKRHTVGEQSAQRQAPPTLGSKECGICAGSSPASLSQHFRSKGVGSPYAGGLHLGGFVVTLAVAAAGSLQQGCGSPKKSVENARSGAPTSAATASGKAVSEQALAVWQRGMQIFEAAEKKDDWSKGNCKQAKKAFAEANKTQPGGFAEALYMMGTVEERCDNSSEARQLYERALAKNPKYCEARVASGLQVYEAGNVASAKQAFALAIRNDPQCAEAYLNLAVAQQRLGEPSQEALSNLRRSLAIRSNYLPAFNEMALLYLRQARRGGSTERLDLGEVVCRQAQLIDEKYAPIYNTWGLINVEKGEVIVALRMFERAIALDKGFFEAYMNFGSVTTSFRGYKDAKNAFSKAVSLRPKSYDAHIGLGSALRGTKEYKLAEKHYNEALSLEKARPEAYYNLAVLYQDYMGGNIADLTKAKSYFRDFLARAKGDKRYAENVKSVTRQCTSQQGKNKRRGRAKCRPGRMQNIDTAISALRAAAEMQKR